MKISTSESIKIRRRGHNARETLQLSKCEQCTWVNVYSANVLYTYIDDFDAILASLNNMKFSGPLSLVGKYVRDEIKLKYNEAFVVRSCTFTAKITF